MTTLVSVEERVFLEDGVAKDVREDGRGRAQYREIALETGIISHANGSVRVKLDCTEVLIGVKLEIGVTDPKQPSQGRIECVVDWCVVSRSKFTLSYDFISSPLQTARHSEDDLEEINSSLADQIVRVLRNGHSLDLEALAILEGNRCWIVHIDVIVGLL